MKKVIVLATLIFFVFYPIRKMGLYEITEDEVVE